MEVGDLVKFVKYYDSNLLDRVSYHLVGKTGVLIRKVTDSIAEDWGAAWDVLVGDEVEPFCYERWMEVISENR